MTTKINLGNYLRVSRQKSPFTIGRLACHLDQNWELYSLSGRCFGLGGAIVVVKFESGLPARCLQRIVPYRRRHPRVRLYVHARASCVGRRHPSIDVDDIGGASKLQLEFLLVARLARDGQLGQLSVAADFGVGGTGQGRRSDTFEVKFRGGRGDQPNSSSSGR